MSERNKTRFNSLKHSKLGVAVAGLALTAVSVAGVSELGKRTPDSSLITRDKIVEVEEGTPAPAGFKAIHKSQKAILKELDGSNQSYNLIVARDQKGNQGVYEFSWPFNDGRQNVIGVADSLKQIGSQDNQDDVVAQQPAEIIAVPGEGKVSGNYIEESSGSNAQGQNNELYLLVQPAHGKHPIAFEVGSPGDLQITHDLQPNL